MSLVKWPVNPRALSIESMFNNFFDNDEDFNNSIKRGITVPAVNISDTDDSYELALAAPGKLKEDFEIEIIGKNLVISSEDEKSNETKSDNFTRQEYSFNSFCRSFALPQNSLEDEINAKYEDGILRVVIPKSPDDNMESKKIAIK